MSAFSTEEMVESFKFLPRYNLDLLLLVCRQWNHLVKTFERQLSLHKLRANFHISSTLQKAHAELQRINFHRKFRPIDKRLKKSAVKMSLEYIHPENQAICPEGPHKELFSFLGSHIKNSTVSLNLTGSMPHGLIKDLIEGQIQRNCSIVCILLFLCQPFSSIMYNHESESVLNPEISLAELLKASFLSATKSVSLLQPIRETNEIGPFMTLVDHCTIVCSPANRSRQPVPRLSVSWHFNHNFPEQFIEIFKNSRKDDWPEHIVVTAVSKIEKPGREYGSWAIALSEAFCAAFFRDGANACLCGSILYDFSIVPVSSMVKYLLFRTHRHRAFGPHLDCFSVLAMLNGFVTLNL
ncbi:hypothetical protein Ddc_16127 [Ditylenchus destructor]|nr:hypothetical protein Ddc_16127 [Ditylenchus destructor]